MVFAADANRDQCTGFRFANFDAQKTRTFEPDSSTPEASLWKGANVTPSKPPSPASFAGKRKIRVVGPWPLRIREFGLKRRYIPMSEVHNFEQPT